MNKVSTTLLALVATTGSLHAQLAIEGGVSLATMSITGAGTKLSTGFKVGPAFGILGDMRLTDHLFFEPGIFYQGAGCTLTGTPTGDYSVNTITVPVNVVYKTGERCGKRWMLSFGLYVAENLGGEYSRDAVPPLPQVSGPLVIGDDATSNLKAMDVGLDVGIGFQTKKHFYFRGRYQLGMTNLLPNGDGDNSIKSSAIVGTIGFLFGSCETGVRGWGKRGPSHWRGVKKGRWSTKPRNYNPKWLNE